MRLKDKVAIITGASKGILETGASLRGINRGPMITEASAEELEAWLRQEGFLK